MNFNESSNVGSILGRKINQSIRSARDNVLTADDLSITQTRAGWQQRYGAMQMENVLPNSYALFGGWSGSSTTVAP